MRVLAALSGGVDSAVAAALAVEAGYDVTGVHMALSSEPQSCRVGSRGCCSVEDSADAARAAEIIGIPYYVWDLAEEFEETVISDFLSEYQAGHTPNPCVRCNEFVKFRELAERAKLLGFDAVCTGHYARRIDGPGGPELHRGMDEAKDQSYVLAVIGPEELERVILPLGDAPNKAWVREEAERRGLGVSNKPDPTTSASYPTVIRGDSCAPIWEKSPAKSWTQKATCLVNTPATTSSPWDNAKACGSSGQRPTANHATSWRHGHRPTRWLSVLPLC